MIQMKAWMISYEIFAQEKFCCHTLLVCLLILEASYLIHDMSTSGGCFATSMVS